MSGTTSPLTMQMLLASGGGVQQDPAVAAALPRLNMAQAMMQNSTSTAPTTKWGALSQLAQGLLGGYTFDKANEGLQDIYKQRQSNSVNALNSFFGNNPVGSPAASPSSPTPASASPSAQTFATQLAPAEGGANPKAVNDQGYSGQFQFGAGRLAEDGVYTPADGENLKANQWRGTFNIPGFPTVKTQQDFLNNPAAQHATLMLDVAKTDQAIANTPGADQFDQNGLRGVAHLGGRQGMADFVASGGKVNPSDSNGTALGNYYKTFSTGTPVVSGGAPATGQNAPQTSQSLQMMRQAMAYGAANPYDPQAQRVAGQMMDYAKTLGTLDTFKTGVGGIQTNQRTGQQIAPVAPLPDYHTDPNIPGVLTSTGQKPVVLPAPRAVTDVHGVTHALGGGNQDTVVGGGNPSGISGTTPEANAMRTIAELSAKPHETWTPQDTANYNAALPIYQGFKSVTTMPGQTVTQIPTRPVPLGAPPAALPSSSEVALPVPPPESGIPSNQNTPPGVPHGSVSLTPAVTPTMPEKPSGVVVAPNTGAIAAQAQAAAQGGESGKNAALTSGRMVKMGTEAAQGLGTIDSALSQINQAQQEGIPTGYFTPALATAAAAAKNLGIDTSKLGIDPAAVSNIQAANKSLALTAGSIVRQILGPDSQITEGKLETFIHATPGLNTDPQAIQKILGWARSQFVYNHNMALDAMQHADPNTGMISPGWEPQYYTKQGSFGPIYNPLHGDMEQPSGQAPSPTMPEPLPSRPSRSDIESEMRRRGLLK